MYVLRKYGSGERDQVMYYFAGGDVWSAFIEEALLFRREDVVNLCAAAYAAKPTCVHVDVVKLREDLA